MSQLFLDSRRDRSMVFADRRVVLRTGLALAVANARYWTTVAPMVRSELARWTARAMQIEEPRLRSLALLTLQAEGFAAEVAATLATLTPYRSRTTAIRAIVALEVMYDYLDALTEQPAPDPLANGRLLFKAFTDAIDPGADLAEDYYRHCPSGADGGYLAELAATVTSALASLPVAQELAPAMLRAAARCAEAEVLTHAAILTDTSGVERWARESADGSGLEDLRDAVVAFHSFVKEMSNRHGGFVVDLLGNAALVLFSYPVAHEHAAEQAVRAGLALCAAAGMGTSTVIERV